MRITVAGEEQSFRAVNLQNARGRDVVALQTETGYGLDEIVAMGEDKTKHALINKFIEYLSEHNRGRFLTWDEVLDRPMPTIEADAGDLKRAGVEGDENDEVPTSAPTASQPDGADDATETAAADATPASKSSTTASRGSRTRSTRGSSTR